MPRLACWSCGRQIYTPSPVDSLFSEERRCPRCGAVHKLYVQVCRVCGEDMYLPDPRDVRHPEAG